MPLFPFKGFKWCQYVSVKHLISMKMHFSAENPSTEKLPTTLPMKLPSSNLNLQQQ